MASSSSAQTDYWLFIDGTIALADSSVGAWTGALTITDSQGAVTKLCFVVGRLNSAQPGQIYVVGQNAVGGGSFGAAGELAFASVRLVRGGMANAEPELSSWNRFSSSF